MKEEQGEEDKDERIRRLKEKRKKERLTERKIQSVYLKLSERGKHSTLFMDEGLDINLEKSLKRCRHFQTFTISQKKTSSS